MHLFILAATNMHSYPFLQYITDMCGVKRETLKVLFFDIDSEEKLPSQYILEGIDIYYSKDWKDTSIYADVKNITTNSLSSFKGQAEFIHKIFDQNLAIYDQLIIRITDDETDRWNKIYDNNDGILTISNKAHVDKFTLSILEQASRFICLYRPWGKTLEKILDRKLEIYNISILVDPFAHAGTYNFYTSVLRPSVRKQTESSKVIRVLIHTKSTPINKVLDILYKDLFSFIIHNGDLLNSRVLEVSLWWPTSIRSMPAFHLAIGSVVLLAKLKNIKIRFSFINSMPTEVYYSFLSSVHILVAQNRGGLGAIFEASKIGSIVVFNKDSYNAEVYSGYGSIPFMECSENENIFKGSIKLFKDNNFEELLDKQKSIAIRFFEEEFFKSKNILVDLYS